MTVAEAGGGAGSGRCRLRIGGCRGGERNLGCKGFHGGGGGTALAAGGWQAGLVGQTWIGGGVGGGRGRAEGQAAQEAEA
jgi:hypothetical protein